MLIVTCCQGSEVTEPITDSEPVKQVTSGLLVGIWKSSSSGFLIGFNADGTYQHAASKTQLDTVPFERGTYEVDGNKLTFIPADTSFGCAGEIGIYSIVVLPSGEIRFNRVEDSCNDRDATFFTFPYGRVE
jgi:hypothetical protein